MLAKSKVLAMQRMASLQMCQHMFAYQAMGHIILADIAQRQLKTIITLQQSKLPTRIQVVVLLYSYFPLCKVCVCYFIELLLTPTLRQVLQTAQSPIYQVQIFLPFLFMYPFSDINCLLCQDFGIDVCATILQQLNNRYF